MVKINYSTLGAMMLVLMLLLGCSSDSKTIIDKGFTVPFTPSTNLEADFQHPPDYARTRVWWIWNDGYITKQGILDDLSAMKKAGIVGAMIYDIGSGAYYEGTFNSGRSVFRTEPGPVFMSREWRNLFKYACQVADSLEIEITMNILSGFNTGGPWVTPEYASQKLVWSETEVEGGKKIDMQLPLPKGFLN